jgi:hypothetical protein
MKILASDETKNFKFRQRKNQGKIRSTCLETTLGLLVLVTDVVHLKPIDNLDSEGIKIQLGYTPQAIRTRDSTLFCLDNDKIYVYSLLELVKVF